MAPRALATADVTGASYDNVVWGGYVTQTSSVTNSISDEKSPFTSLMDGVMIIIIMAVVLFLNKSCLVPIVVLA